MIILQLLTFVGAIIGIVIMLTDFIEDLKEVFKDEEIH
jgi:hypothetical protein